MAALCTSSALRLVPRVSLPASIICSRSMQHAAAVSSSDGYEIGNNGISLSRLGIKLVVCDMAGTTVEEHGLVYKVLRESMVHHGLTVSVDEMHPWHGAAKGAVVRHFIESKGYRGTDLTPDTIDATFEDRIQAAYAEPGAVSHIAPNLPDWVADLHASGIQIALNTGYPINIQEKLIDGLGLANLVDHWISASQVAAGRPAPFMVHRLMEASGVVDVKQVCKVGDTVNDIAEGRNAGCGFTVGVLSGADDAAALLAAGADLVVPDVTSLRI